MALVRTSGAPEALARAAWYNTIPPTLRAWSLRNLAAAGAAVQADSSLPFSTPISGDCHQNLTPHLNAHPRPVPAPADFAAKLRKDN